MEPDEISEHSFESYRQTMEETGLSRSTIERLIRSGAIEARKLGRRVMINKKSRRGYMASLPTIK